MRTLGMIALVGLMVGCGGEATLDEKMQGTWIVTTPGPFDCANGLTIANGRYVAQYLCALQAGGFGTELEGGTYSVQGNAVAFSYSDQTSCPASDHSAATATVTVQGDSLTMAFPGVVVTMNRAPSGGPSMGAIVKTGCWDDTGSFTPFPVQHP